jgi:hypothetical protein
VADLSPSQIPGGFHHGNGAVVEHGRVTVGRVSTHVDDRGGRRVLAGFLEAVDDHLTLERADLEVVERHVVVRAFERAVVGDDRDALLLGVRSDGNGRAVVVDEEHDAAALRELLVGDRGVGLGVALSVLNVDLEAGGLEPFGQVLAVQVLPAVRGRRVGQDDAGASRLSVAPASCGRTSGQCDGRQTGDRDNGDQ